MAPQLTAHEGTMYLVDTGIVNLFGHDVCSDACLPLDQNSRIYSA